MIQTLAIALGIVMIVGLFSGIAVAGARLVGWREVLITYAGVAAVIAFISGAVSLIAWGTS